MVKFLSMRFFIRPVTSSLLDPDFLGTIFMNTPKPCSSLNIRECVLHQYKATGKIIILCA